jgi:hypothetical protein
MTTPTATVLLVFGRGVTYDHGSYALTTAGAERVQAVIDYVTAHETAFVDAARHGSIPLIVFSGGWAEAAEGADPPPAGCREGDLMLCQARAAGLHRYAQLRAETGSRSTLENLLGCVEGGLFDGHDFSAAHPLGIVSHAWHLPRIRFLAGRVLGLRGAALLDVPATGHQTPVPWRSERAARLLARLGFLGARSAAALLRRERAMVASLRRAELLTRRRPRRRAGGEAHTTSEPGLGKEKGTTLATDGAGRAT